MSKPWTNQNAFQVLAYTEDGKILDAYGTTKPTDATAGYKSGALFRDVDSGVVYVNVATNDTSCDFDALGTTSGITLAGSLTVSGAQDIVMEANTAAALEFSDSTTKIIGIDTRNTIKNVNGVIISSPATTIASEGAAHENPSLKLANKTITYTGTTGTTSQLGGLLNVGVLTITDASAMTLTTASAVHINAVAAAGGMLTISNSRMISTSVSDAYLTNAGVWTDTACWGWGKDNVLDATADMIDDVLEKITPRSWTYKGDVHGDDRGRQRVGIAYDDLPEELRAPGQETGVAPGVLASFALAALKMLRDENRDLQARLARLEAA